MDKIRNAAIILLGMGDKAAAEILKNLNPREVQSIIEAINDIENVSEKEVVKALNEFFREANNNLGIDVVSKEYIKNSLVSSVGIKGIDGIDSEKIKWIEILKYQPMRNIIEIIQDEHPQIITSLIVILSNQTSEKASDLIKCMPKDMQNQIIKRMTYISPISTYGIDVLSVFFDKQFEDPDKFSAISVDGVEAVANIISYLDSDTEHEIMNYLSTDNQQLSDLIQDKLLPFDRLAELDGKSLQTLLREIDNDDLAIALKGVDDYVKNAFMKQMSSKSAEILKDDMEVKGPVKMSKVIEAQKKIILEAKKLAKEEKIVLASKNDNDIVF